ncbi:MAG: hypothetical protein IIA63_05860 [Nitrospinae bacterium]|nr:hypothetical protein [Nitrospinota bacterium]
MTDTEIIEQYFKARGWEYYDEPPLAWKQFKDKYGLDNDDYIGWYRNGICAYDELPSILTDFSAFKAHVLKVMEEEGYYPCMVLRERRIPAIQDFYWRHNTNPYMKPDYQEEIIDNNILHAGVISAARYFKEQNANDSIFAGGVNL